MSDLTYQDVLNILRLIDSGQFENFQVDINGTKLKVTRKSGRDATGQAARPVPHTAAAPKRIEPANVLAPGAETKPQIVPAQAVPNIQGGMTVNTPMAGTFYASPAPGAAPFVEMNKAVKAGDQLGIVEVMKLFTSVNAPCDGVIRAILVKNEEFVQSEQALIVIEPKKGGAK